MLALWIFLLIVGFVLLVKGADWFVDGSAAIAQRLKIPALVIGLTVVAFGTSAPELAVSIASAVRHSTDIAVGNVVGSNIANILLILGVSSLFHNLPVQKSSIRLDMPVVILASILLIVLGWIGESLNWVDGVILLVVFAFYMFLLFRQTIRDQKKGVALQVELPSVEEDVPKGKLGAWIKKNMEKNWFLILLVLVGLAMVAGGGSLLVKSAEEIAIFFHIDDRIIALTIVAIGTSLPELVTSVVAARKGETDIAVGNILGSNIFNIFLVAGMASLFYPLAFTHNNLIDAIVALAAALLLFVFGIANKKHELNKISGAVMLVCFVGYYVYLFLVTFLG